MQNRYSFFVIHFENKTMVRRCCVPKCTGNSNEENKERVFRFPNKDEEKQVWRKAIPRTNLLTSINTAICERHWPPGCTGLNVMHLCTCLSCKPRPLHVRACLALMLKFYLDSKVFLLA